MDNYNAVKLFPLSRYLQMTKYLEHITNRGITVIWNDQNTLLPNQYKHACYWQVYVVDWSLEFVVF